MKFKNILIALICSLLLIACLCVALARYGAATADTYDDTLSTSFFDYIEAYVRVSSNSYLNVRKEASSSSDILGRLYLNDQVQIVETIGKWHKIVYNDSHAFVYSEYIENEPLEIIYDDVPYEHLVDYNIPYLTVRYVGYLKEKSSAYPLKSTKRNCYIPEGPIALFSVKGEYAIFAKGRKLLRIKTEDFERIETLDIDADICQEPVIAAYTTFFSTSKENRVNNILLGAEAMKAVVEPGGTYSFNSSVGIRSPQKGYLLADAYKGQEVVQDFGGGVCQLSSTLYAAIRNIPYFGVLQRYPHSMDVSYLPFGMDATVNWNNRDLKFENCCNFKIYVNTYINNGMLTILISKTP